MTRVGIGYHIIDASGRSYCVVSSSLGEAYKKFQKYSESLFDDHWDNIEDAQSITPIGDVLL